ncbi:formimidoyltransferase-cyclodeaminase isoform X8 [Gallus gallus]|uniref:formimidoyltransferase-cyclodeaminase isoform X8 n=1 Tax=Gallus gallus TaxID=9031 RepID=UPI001F011027|nr:formimidoyltransferase-cyclodeaminase isoform X8 [Gallus gallus]XP_046799381.1 formimidoyltransferase-cyclodeaminase isoform X8 [Gallus gallus]
MAKLVECVPNFSEGCNKELLISALPTGEHPRMGALDVCPFVPVMNISMEECVICAHVFGQRLSEELGVPVYLYGEAARQESRRTLPAIRAGEYEALPKKLEKPEWVPDFGPPTFVPQWGATVTGARTFLIAYNINLLCTKELAHRIALNIREQGRGADQPGSLKKVQGIGWYLEEENIAQVSTNLLDFETTPLHAVYEEVCYNAEALKLPVVGSQLVGLVPKKAMLDAAEFYIKKEKLFILEEEHKIKLVMYLVQAGQEDKGLVTKPLGAFVRAVGGRSAAPGGGSVAATAASLGAALGCMVGLMSYGKRQFEQLDSIMRNVIPPLHQAMDELVAMVDADSRAFSSYMEAMKLPKSTPEERERRVVAMQQGLKTAVEVPCTLAVKVNNLWSSLKMLAHHGNLACKSDLQVGAKMLEAAVFGAYFNVMINLKDITDEKFKTETSQMVTRLLEEAKQGSALVLALLEKREA